jgi:hypothetical protein
LDRPWPRWSLALAWWAYESSSITIAALHCMEWRVRCSVYK